MENLKHNANMLTTPWDIHEMLLEMLKFTGAGTADISNRGVSLFKRIPENRTCASAQVDDHWCACLDWTSIDPNSQRVKEATKEIISFFNSKTESYRSRCPLLELDKVISASESYAKEAVLKFKDTNDGGRGRFGLMTDNTKVSIMTYQVTLQTRPGGGQFEVTLSRNKQSGAWYLDRKSVSRINKYGDAPKCVASEAPHLREYCVCQN